MIGACCCHSHYSRHQALVANGIVPRTTTSPAPSPSANADGGAELHTATPSLRERLTAADSALVRTNAEQKALVPPRPLCRCPRAALSAALLLVSVTTRSVCHGRYDAWRNAIGYFTANRHGMRRFRC